MKPLAMLVVPVIMLFALGSIQNVQAAPQLVEVRPASAQPTRGPTPSPGASAPSPANYDEQIGITFAQSFNSIAYNVTALAQSDTDGYGPAYLLNGLSDGGYWYQIGISYNWPYMKGGYNSGFSLLYEVFDSSGKSVFPSAGGSGQVPLSGPVNSGDIVLLNLYFSSSQVELLARDWNTSATASQTFTAHGTRFVGLDTAANSNGFFTGLMTEWYHVDPYYGDEVQVTYSDPHFTLTSAVMWADEYNVNTTASVFEDRQSVSFTNPTQLLSFASHGATSYANAYTFITGSKNVVSVTLSFSVAGGGSGYSAPTITYTFDGVSRTEYLNQSPTIYLVDAGTSWNASASLLGGSSTERWRAAQPPGGTAAAGTEESIVYYHQFLYSFSYVISGGGTGYSPPQVHTTQFGALVTETGNRSDWADAGATASYSSQLGGSSASERWISPDPVATVSAAGGSAVKYFHQFGVGLSYRLPGGGSPGAPVVKGLQFGKVYDATIANGTTYYFDPGTFWSAPVLLPGSSSAERWVATQATNGTASGPAVLVLVYQHQYALAVNMAPGAGGSATSLGGWEDAGSSLRLSQSTNQGWQFEGWVGSGTGAYTGSSNSSTITMGSPIVENATFYPGLHISSGSDGSVSYSFGTYAGNVPPRSSATVFVPPGTEILLRAAPSSVFYTFTAWSPQGNHSAGSETTIDLDAPGSVTARFSLNTSVLGGILLGAAAIGAAVVFALRSRRRS